MWNKGDWEDKQSTKLRNLFLRKKWSWERSINHRFTGRMPSCSEERLEYPDWGLLDFSVSSHSLSPSWNGVFDYDVFSWNALFLHVTASQPSNLSSVNIPSMSLTSSLVKKKKNFQYICSSIAFIKTVILHLLWLFDNYLCTPLVTSSRRVETYFTYLFYSHYLVESESRSVMSNSLWPHTGVCCHFLLQGMFTTQGSNPGLLSCRQTLYHLSHQGSPQYLVGVWQIGTLSIILERIILERMDARMNSKSANHMKYECYK